MDLIKWCKNSIKNINEKNLPVVMLDPVYELDKCNKLLEWIENNGFVKKQFLRSRSGGISKCIENIEENGFEVKFGLGRNIYELLIYSLEFGWGRVQFRNCKKNKNDAEGMKIFGTAALEQLIALCPTIMNDLSTDEAYNAKCRKKAQSLYHIESNNMAFEGIPADAEIFNGKELKNCVCSLDIHSAFPASFAEVRPEVANVLISLYNERKEKPENKRIMNLAIGTMTSDTTKRIYGVKGAFAPLRLEILENHAKYLCGLAKQIEAQGGIIINYRTDSIKFIWNKNEKPIIRGEGTGLGQWSYDFYKADCYRQFSTGCYQWKVGDEHHVKFSGVTAYEEQIKAREDWEWEDLEKALNSPIIKKWRYNFMQNRFEQAEAPLHK